jgi:Tfp pilus assembly protein PilZ
VAARVLLRVVVMTPFASSIVQQATDRRRAIRARLGVNVTITVADRLVDALGVDVSPGGMRVVASEAARIGDEVSLVFFLNGDIVSARGTVQWCSPTKRGLATFGVRFTMLEEDGPSLVASYCRSSLS